MADQQNIIEGKLLTRLSFARHTHRSGSPGFHWKNARVAHMSSAIYSALQRSDNWGTGSTDRELMGAWQSITAAHHWKPDLFDSWDEGSMAQGRTIIQRATNCKRAASISRKATGKPALLAAVESARGCGAANPIRLVHLNGRQSKLPVTYR